MTNPNRQSLGNKLRAAAASLLLVAVPAHTSQQLPMGIDLRAQSGWVRYGTVVSVSPNVIQLAPIAGARFGRTPIAGQVTAVPTLQEPGQITATTRVWTAEALRGFEGSVIVFLLDENKQLLFQTHERHWGVNGEAIPGGAPSSRTENWTEPIPENVLAQTRYLAILHADHPLLHWEDALEQFVVGVGYVLMAGVCIVFTGGFEYSDHEVTCGSGGGDNSEGSAAIANKPTLANMVLKAMPQQMPHSGQVVWLNRTTKQALWTEFPISAHRKDDVGTSHYVETWVKVSYPVTANTTSPKGQDLMNTAAANKACCSITGIDLGSAIVTARVKGVPERMFHFKVANPALLRSLTVGQGVYANFSDGKASVDGVTPCCNIVILDPSPAVSNSLKGKPNPNPLEPCCSVTAINEKTGIVSAEERATHKTFQFQVGSSSLLKSLKIGQGVYANFAKKQVSVDGLTPCCNLVGVPVALSVPPSTPQSSASSTSGFMQETNIPNAAVTSAHMAFQEPR